MILVRHWLSLAVAGAVLGARVAGAVPVISIDLDPTTPGIQSTSTVSLGAIVDVDVVFSGDGVSTFDAVSLDVFFNSGGLAVVAVPPPRAGDIAPQGRAPLPSQSVSPSSRP